MNPIETPNKSAPQKRKNIRKIGEKPEKKKVRTASLPEILTAHYSDNLSNLVTIQHMLEKSLTEHPVYQEYHRKDQTEKLYKGLRAQHKKASAEIAAFHSQLRREHKSWVKKTRKAEKIKHSEDKNKIVLAERIGMFAGSLLTRIKRLFSK